EEDLRQSEYKYRCLFEHLPDAAFLCDSATGRIIDTNRRGERLLERDRSAVLGMRLSQFVAANTFRTLLAVGQNDAGTGVELAAEINPVSTASLRVKIHASVVPVSKRRLLLVFIREPHDSLS